MNTETTYHWVTLSPIPGKPAWHEQSKPSSYPFPTRRAAELFAANHAMPGRVVTIS